MGTAPEISVSGQGRRVALVVSRFNEDVTAELVAGAREALAQAGVAENDISEYSVAGAFELAPGCRQVLAYGPEVDAVIALGTVVRGETPHFTFISQAAAQALQTLATESNIALAFGLLTTDTHDQALERASRSGGDKGGEAARAALGQAALYEQLRSRQPAVRGFRLS